ncbi:transcription factor [Fusarium albosuccineum]|uniref:Transcription factor n=1 Tax=Fusarium albosuccineum TaxID=1237068 RepID=A0A8H4PII5_9HYPO|nr:transcription factor [Fusarium albosuccineum]
MLDQVPNLHRDHTRRLTTDAAVIHADNTTNLVFNIETGPSNFQLPIPLQETTSIPGLLGDQEHASNQSNRFLGEGSMAQPPNFTCDLACDTDLDFPMNWLPYNNEIETNYYSMLGLETELAPAGPLGPPSANGSTACTNISDYADTAVAQSRILPPTSLSPGSAVAASPQLSMSSDRTLLGDLYATSSNGARRPCTAKSKQLFPPLGIQRSKHLPSISSDRTLQDESVHLWGFPDLSHLIIEETEDYHPEPILTVSTYDKIYEAFTQICFDSAPFANQYTSTEFPSLKILDYCVKLFFQHFNHIFPLVHPHLTNLDTSWVLALAICAVGSQYSATEEIDSCVLPLHEFLSRVLAIQLENSVLELPLAQALVLSQVSLLYYGTSQLRHTAYNRVGNLHEIINNFRRTSNLDFENAARARLDQTEADIQAEWILWVDRETWRRLCYFVWLLDRMAGFFFNYHLAGAFDVTDISLPHDGLWSLKTSLDWAAVYRQIEG